MTQWKILFKILFKEIMDLDLHICERASINRVLLQLSYYRLRVIFGATNEATFPRHALNVLAYEKVLLGKQHRAAHSNLQSL